MLLAVLLPLVRVTRRAGVAARWQLAGQAALARSGFYQAVPPRLLVFGIEPTALGVAAVWGVCPEQFRGLAQSR